MIQCCHIVVCYEILDQNRPVYWSIVVNEKLAVGSQFFGAFPSDRIPKTMKDVNVHFFIHNFTFRDELIIIRANCCNLYQQIPRTF